MCIRDRRYVNQFDEISGETDVWEYDSTLTVVNKMIVDVDGYANIIDLLYPLDDYPFGGPIFSYILKLNDDVSQILSMVTYSVSFYILSNKYIF